MNAQLGGAAVKVTLSSLLTCVYSKASFNVQLAISVVSPSANVNALDPMNRVKVV